ncbi:hypothetical protein BOX15_Mlig001438g3 [Macrostomum lignano]|uniref:Major facilitator superfamily (MFS) profile domain-containing protein n=1 Tax=Macrostomum lignano TaxID=282301 RepID=A0A267ECU3_9PLAT|nr:hypothetical protein BOX15_Mlig001438g3 [Macrostomum lignano]
MESERSEQKLLSPSQAAPKAAPEAAVSAVQDSRDRVTWRLALSVLAAFWGAVHFGWNTGVINNPKDGIVSFLNQSVADRFDRQLSDYQLELLWSLVVSIFAIGGMGGALTGGCLADRLGRSRALLGNSGFGIAAAIACSVSSVASSPELLVLGRLATGFCSAVYTSVVPLYISETAPRRLRGGFGVLNQLGVVSGLLLSQVASTDSLLGRPGLWPLLFALSAAPCLLQLALLPCCPESPRHLLLTRRSEAAARSALATLRGHDFVDAELAEIDAERSAGSSASSSATAAKLCSQPELRRPLLIGLVLHLSQQLSGINVIFYYSSDLFVAAGASPQASKFATVAVGCVMVAMTGVTVPLMDRAGRRCLHLTGLLGVLVSSVGFTICFSLHSRSAAATPAGALTYASICFALLIVVFFALGPGSIPWLMLSEMFQQEARSAANAIGVLVNWLANFAVGLVFPVLVKHLGSLLFLPFSVLTAAFLLFLFCCLPETKGRPIEAIAAGFRSDGDGGGGLRWRRPSSPKNGQAGTSDGS